MATQHQIVSHKGSRLLFQTFI